MVQKLNGCRILLEEFATLTGLQGPERAVKLYFSVHLFKDLTPFSISHEQ